MTIKKLINQSNYINMYFSIAHEEEVSSSNYKLWEIVIASVVFVVYIYWLRSQPIKVSDYDRVFISIIFFILGAFTGYFVKTENSGRYLLIGFTAGLASIHFIIFSQFRIIEIFLGFLSGFLIEHSSAIKEPKEEIFNSFYTLWDIAYIIFLLIIIIFLYLMT